MKAGWLLAACVLVMAGCANPRNRSHSNPLDPSYLTEFSGDVKAPVLATSLVGQSTLVLTWGGIPGDLIQTDPMEYRVYARSTPFGSSFEGSLLKQIKPSGAKQYQLSVASLTTNTTYYFKVFIYRGGQLVTEWSSNEVVATTLP